MKVTEFKPVSTRVVTQVVCDKCGAELAQDTLAHYEVEITHGEYVPYEGHISWTSAMDLCEPCTDGLRILLKANGYNVQDES